MSQLTPDDTLLGLLAFRSQHGYDLLDCFRDPHRLGVVWDLSTSQLYAVLKRLESGGLATRCEVASRDGPVRQIYELTDVGAERFHAWLHEPRPPASVRRVRVEFLSRLYLARLLNIPTVPIVEAQRRTCEMKRHELAEIVANAEPGVGRLTNELMLAQFDTILLWLERCELTPKIEE